MTSSIKGIYACIRKINNTLNNDFGVKNPWQRLIFTAATLAGASLGLYVKEEMTCPDIRSAVVDTLRAAAKSGKIIKENEACVELLIKLYNEIEVKVCNPDITDGLLSGFYALLEMKDQWEKEGIDIGRAIYNTIFRLQERQEGGIVLTPPHIVSLLCRIMDVDDNDCVLDACCGTGSVLYGSLWRSAIQENGNSCTAYGMELNPYMVSFAFAIALLLECTDKIDLIQMDASTTEAGEWIQSKRITKVIMNPPYSAKDHPVKIIQTVLEHVPPGTKCAFILPDTKLEKPKKNRQILKFGALEKIIKLPANTFSGVPDVSVFIFEAGQNKVQGEIYTCWIQEDGLVTDRSTGERLDVNDQWDRIENKWAAAITQNEKAENCRWINPEQSLRFLTEVEGIIQEKDFRDGLIDYLLSEKSVDLTTLHSLLFERILNTSNVISDKGSVHFILPVNNLRNFEFKGESGNPPKKPMVPTLDTCIWKDFNVGDLFNVCKGRRLMREDIIPGEICLIGASKKNNGVVGTVGNQENVYDGNVLTLCVNRSVGACFYQAHKCWATDDLVVLIPVDEIGKFELLFIAQVIRIKAMSLQVEKLKISEVKDLKIILPVDKDGKYPDYHLIKNYMIELERDVSRKLGWIDSVL